MDEAGWIAASKAGDVQAFNQLVIAYQQVVYSLALRMLRDQEAAAEATQDAFLSAFTRIHQFRGGSFKAWLLRIVLNLVYDQLRRAKRHPSQSLETACEDADAAVLQITNGGPTPEEVALSRELMACLEMGLETLPAEQRATVILSDLQGMGYEEVAAATGASLGTVKSRLSRGRQAMREYLSGHLELLPSPIRHYFERGAPAEPVSPRVAVDR